MASQAELAVTSFDHGELKRSLIEYLQTKPGFEDVNYEGSAINTIIDLLTRNSTYNSFLANMVANESFIQSAQIRGNVSAHAQKLSYVPRSRTAARAVLNLEIHPAEPPTELIITENPGLVFLSNVGGVTYTFSTRDRYTFTYNTATNSFLATDVEVYQGQYLNIRSTYTGKPIVLNNKNIDTSTLRVTVDDGEVSIVYTHANSLTELGADKTVYFLSENSQGFYEIEFGKDLVGVEPAIGASVYMEYINTQDEIANGVQSFIPASTIGDYSNISIEVTQKSYGGYDRDSIEEIRFLAPRAYQAQNRALAYDDYEILVKEAFPFIRSIRVWGGEDNDPPRFGNVMISVIPDAGLEVTTTLNDRIISVLRQKGVGSVTPVLVPPNIFTLSLSVDYKLRSDVANVLAQTDVETYIKQTIQDYSLTQLRRFNIYYNESEIIDLLKNRRDIESVSISKTVSNLLDSYRNITSIYEVKFDNPIVPGTFYVLNFRINNLASTETIYDDGNGNIIHSQIESGVTNLKTIGTIDYESGLCTFTTRFAHQNPTIQVIAEPREDNFYTKRNNSVEIISVDTKRVDHQRFS